MTRARSFVFENSLALAFLVLFLGALIGQAFAGFHNFNHAQTLHHSPHLSFWRYVSSSNFGSDVMENWQSEYLQFTLYMLLTVWLVQRGSPESKEPHRAGRGSEQEQLIGEHAHPRSPIWARV